MALQHHQGDLLASDCTVIAHGCNCFNTMGSGIARAIRARYPLAYTADCQTVRGDQSKLGSYTTCAYPDRQIFNLYTQYRFGTDRVHVDYEAVVDALQAMKAWLDKHDPDHKEIVGLPRIGCGLAGGDWAIVEELISNVFHDRTVHIYTL
jgi:O-acetyl-ADP-ribose deacetylase (regulator of RNase III)